MNELLRVQDVHVNTDGSYFLIKVHCDSARDARQIKRSWSERSSRRQEVFRLTLDNGTLAVSNPSISTCLWRSK